MKIWESLIDEFVKDVKNYHIFKEVKVYYLSSDNPKPKLYKKKSLTSAINEKWYRAIDQNSITFMFSDMLSKAWSSGELLNQISSWQNHFPFAIVQMLPQRLWNGTKLIDASMGKMSSQKRFVLNCHLVSRAEEILQIEEKILPKLIKLPLLNFSEDSIDEYGKVMRSLPNSQIEGALFETEDFRGEYQPTQTQNTLNAEQRLRTFYKYASTQAKILLELLAVVPLSLPIIKLVQQKLLPQSTQEHLSEIFMSSIIDKEQKVDGFYQFSKLKNEESGVREELIKKIGARKAFETITKLSEVIKRHGGVFDFLAFVVDPDSLKYTHEFSEIDREFARISVNVLHEMGGKYCDWADRLVEYSFENNSIEPLHSNPLILEQPTGTVPLDSYFYIKRKEDEKCYFELHQKSTLIRIQAPRQYGKTSLLARLILNAKEKEYRVVSFNFQEFDKPLLSNLDELLEYIYEIVGFELDIEVKINKKILKRLTPMLKATKYMEKILSKLDRPLVLAIDEADKLFEYEDVSDSFFGLIRVWHEKSKQDINWEKLKILISHSQESFLGVTNINQSPFYNVGLGIELRPFTNKEIKDLALRHNISLSSKELEKFMSFIGGHPFLSRKVLFTMVDENQSFTEIIDNAYEKTSIFSDHMRRYLWMFKENKKLLDFLKLVVNGEYYFNDDRSYFSLKASGLVINTGNKIEFACELYKGFFERAFPLKRIKKYLTPIIPKNEFFIGRKKILDEISDSIEYQKGVVIKGDAGMGKTALIAQYLAINEKTYQHIAYIPNYKNLEQDFIENFSDSLGVKNKNIQEIISELKKLKTNKIMIIDDVTNNIQNEKGDYLNQLYLSGWRIVLLTRADKLGISTKITYEVGGLKADEAKQFLLHYKVIDSKEYSQYEKLFKMLNFNPLQIALIAKSNVSFEELVENLLSPLSEREKAVIRMRFGLLSDESNKTLEEIGKELRVTRQRVHQIESSAIKSLTHPRVGRKLKNYIEDNSILKDITFDCEECSTSHGIDCDELEWESVSSSEGGMGAEVEYEAEYYDECNNCNNDMNITFSCWEYPVGAENYRDVSFTGIENLKGDCCLEFNKPEYEEPEDIPFSNTVREEELKEMERKNLEKIGEEYYEEENSTNLIKNWFLSHYEDPAEHLPYETKEGGYQYIHGEPRILEEVVFSEFGKTYSEEVIRKAIEKIENEHGDMEWSPIPQSEEESEQAFVDWAKRKEQEEKTSDFDSSGIHSNAKEFDKAFDSFYQGVGINPNDDYFYDLGQTYYKIKNYDRAIEVYLKAIRTNPNNDMYFYALGLAYQEFPKYDKAIESFKKAIELNPSNKKAQLSMKMITSILQKSTSSFSVIETQIDGDFNGWEGETIVKLMNGDVWQQSEYHYNYTYSFMPKVKIIQSNHGYKMEVEGSDKAVEVVKLNDNISNLGTTDFIESKIDGEFNGWDGETIFKLMNGQVWQQSTFAFHFSFKFMPKVTIYKSGSGYKMKVEGDNETVDVRRIQ